MKHLNELREKRGKLIKEARDLVDKAREEQRQMTTEESEQFDKMMSKADELRSDIEREERLMEMERSAADTAGQQMEQEGRTSQNEKDETELRTLAMRKYFTHGSGSLNADEVRALQFDSDSAGGYLAAPEQFVMQLIKAVDDAVVIRQKANVLPALNGAHSLGVPSLENDPADADWTAEITAVSEDSTMSFGKRALQPHLVSKLIKVSMKLLNSSAMPAEQIVMDRLAYKFAITEEKAFLTGSGASQPLGLFTASANGISTSRDISTGNTTTSISTDGLMEAFYGVKSQYQGTGEWLFHRDAVKQIAKLKDGDGQYIWKPGIEAGRSDMLLGRPVNQSEYAPNTFTTGLYVGLFGDMSKYWIVDSLAMQVQRLNELYAATNQIGFIGRLETDGMPVLEEAFSRVTLA